MVSGSFLISNYLLNIIPNGPVSVPEETTLFNITGAKSSSNVNGTKATMKNAPLVISNKYSG